MSTKNASLGKTLKDLRENNKLTLRTVEDISGISNAYLSQLENDKIKKPAADILHKLAEVYKVDFNDLLSLAGILGKESTASKSFGEYVFSKKNLTDEEEEELIRYLQFIRQRKKN